MAGCAFLSPLGILLHLDSLFTQAQAIYSQGVVILVRSTASVLPISPAVFFLASMPSVMCPTAHRHISWWFVIALSRGCNDSCSFLVLRLLGFSFAQNTGFWLLVDVSSFWEWSQLGRQQDTQQTFTWALKLNNKVMYQVPVMYWALFPVEVFVSPCYRWGDQGSERLSHLFVFTHPVLVETSTSWTPHPGGWSPSRLAFYGAWTSGIELC